MVNVKDLIENMRRVETVPRGRTYYIGREGIVYVLKDKNVTKEKDLWVKTERDQRIVGSVCNRAYDPVSGGGYDIDIDTFTSEVEPEKCLILLANGGIYVLDEIASIEDNLTEEEKSHLEKALLK